jgi:hypothetical protein
LFLFRRCSRRQRPEGEHGREGRGAKAGVSSASPLSVSAKLK